MRCKSRSNSSAPSMTKSRCSHESQSSIGIPCSIDNFSVASEVGIPEIFNPSSRILLPNSKMVYLTVEPVPIPIRIPFSTKAQAAIPASSFIASFSSAVNWLIARGSTDKGHILSHDSQNKIAPKGAAMHSNTSSRVQPACVPSVCHGRYPSFCLC